jgi:hypothetical protein
VVDAILAYDEGPTKKTRWNLTVAVGEIPTFKPVIYVSDFSESVHASRSRQSNIGISASFNGRRRAISSIFLPMANPRLGHGDIRGTNDLLLFRFTESGEALEVYLLEGRKGLADILFSRFLDGQLDEEIEECGEANSQVNNVFQI